MVSCRRTCSREKVVDGSRVPVIGLPGADLARCQAPSSMIRTWVPAGEEGGTSGWALSNAQCVRRAGRRLLLLRFQGATEARTHPFPPRNHYWAELTGRLAGRQSSVVRTTYHPYSMVRSDRCLRIKVFWRNTRVNPGKASPRPSR